MRMSIYNMLYSQEDGRTSRCSPHSMIQAPRLPGVQFAGLSEIVSWCSVEQTTREPATRRRGSWRPCREQGSQGSSKGWLCARMVDTSIISSAPIPAGSIPPRVSP